MGLCSMWNREPRFTALVNAYTDDLYRYAVWLCRDPAVAEDLVQETFTRAWKALDSLRDEKAAKGWLITTLRRENARRFERPRFEYSQGDPDDYADSVEFYDTSTEAFVLRRALMQIDETYREPLLLQVLAGYTCKEIASELGVSQSAVLSRIFRARQKLRDILEENREYIEVQQI